MTNTNQKNAQNPWQLDIRTRERNLKSGALTDKELEKHLAQLPDMEGSFDSFVTPQPALAQPVVVPVAVADESDDDLDDEDDDDDNDDADDADDTSSGDTTSDASNAGDAGEAASEAVKPEEGGES